MVLVANAMVVVGGVLLIVDLMLALLASRDEG